MIKSELIAPSLVAVSLLSGCQLFSLSSACGPDGSFCIASTTGGTTGAGTTSAGTTGSMPTIPGAPSTVAGTAARLSAVVTWGAASANGSPVIDYFVTTVGDGGLPDGGALDAGGGLTATIPGLTAGVSYTFSVVARNAIGVGPAGVSATVVPFDVPAAPTNVVAQASDAGQIQVTWTAAFDNFSPITGYTVTTSPGGQMVATDATTTVATVSGLADYTAYTFSVTATNDAGVGPAGLSNTVATFTFVTTFSGDGDAGWVDGPPGIAQFFQPFGIAMDTQGNLYVGDSQNELIRKVAPDGTVSTLAGSVRDAGWADGPGATAQFNDPAGVAVDDAGNVYVADFLNNRVRIVAPDGTTSTLAGSGDAGWVDGVGMAAAFFTPGGVAVDRDGNVFVADTTNERIRQILPDGTTTTLAGNGDAGWADGTGGPDGTAAFYYPYGIAVGPKGKDAFVAEFFGCRIRRVALDGGATSTLAGNGDAGWVDGTGGPAGTTEFTLPVGLTTDLQGTVYVADTLNNLVRKVAIDGTTTTLAGNGDAGYADGTGGPDGTAQFFNPVSIAVDPQGVVYVSDYANNRIRKIIQSGL